MNVLVGGGGGSQQVEAFVASIIQFRLILSFSSEQKLQAVKLLADQLSLSLAKLNL